MAFSDIIALGIFVAVVGAVIYGVLYASKQIDAGVASTKESLKAKGLHISATGVSMKTDKRFDRQDYLDATQRGLVNIVESSSLSKYLDKDKKVGAPGSMDRTSSSNSEKKKSRAIFRKKD